MRTVAIIQARMGSTRLPGKALLRIAGYPSAALSALRASNNGLEVIVATPTGSGDDELVNALSEYGLTVFRGSPDDVLSRYCSASANLPADTLVVRLTADNVFPDGNFLSEIINAFPGSGFEYLSSPSPQNRLPYGLGAEAFSLAALRRANQMATSAYDREHVTPWIRRNCRAGIFIPGVLGDADYSQLRCTLDDAEDYQRLLRLFRDVNEPTRIGWLELTKNLVSLPGEPSFHVPYRAVADGLHSEMVLGTVQLGMEYGRVNDSGKPSREQGVAIVRHAISHGITAVDTARAYGDAEEVLGDALRGAWQSRAEVITKLNPLQHLGTSSPVSQVWAAVDQSILASSQALGTQKLNCVLLHRWAHRRLWEGEIWRRLVELREDGRIGLLGASVYETGEALEALDDPDVQHLQIPLNIMDRRWRMASVDKAASARPDVTIHARSIFLQGILIHSADRWPVLKTDEAQRYVAQLSDLVRRFRRESIADLCVAYVRAQSWIGASVIGCESMDQLNRNMKLFLNPKLSMQECSEIESAFPSVPCALLNPAKWSLSDDQFEAARG